MARLPIVTHGAGHLEVVHIALARRRCPVGQPVFVDIIDFLHRHGGVARASQLTASGFRRPEVAKAVTFGRIVKVSRGVYGIPGTSQLSEALANGGLLTCVSAAPIYQLWTLKDARGLHLCRSHPVPEPKIVEHGRTRHPKHGWLPVAGLADVLIHSLRCLPELESLVMIQSAAGRRDIELDFLYSKLPGTAQRAGPGGSGPGDSAGRFAPGSPGQHTLPASWPEGAKACCHPGRWRGRLPDRGMPGGGD